MLWVEEVIKRVIDTVLNHVEQRCEADQGKAPTEKKQIKEPEGSQKREQKQDRQRKFSQPAIVCIRRLHGAQVRGRRSPDEDLTLGI